MQYSEEFSQKIEDCRELYLKHGGQNHELIEQEMRDLGYRDFHRRNLYRRFERGTCRPGWVETYGWDSLVKFHKEKAEREALLSPTGTNNIAQGKAEGRNPGYGVQYDTDPEGVEQSAHDVAPLQGADVAGTYPGVTLAPLAHPRLYSLSPSATRQPLCDFDEFKDWLIRTWPNMKWEFKHQVYIYKHLKRVTDGDCKRLMIFMPPRHGKSELVTVRYPAWMLKQKPETKIIIGSYGQTLANRFSRMVRSALAEDAFHEEESQSGAGTQNSKVDFGSYACDGQFRKRDETEFMNCGLGSRSKANDGSSEFSFHRKNSEAEWETPEGGGVRAVGMGAGVTGYGAHLIIIDDPVKSRAEAESETIREKVWNWFNDDIYTRLQPDGKIILIQTRWHEDDLAGRLLREASEEGGEQWEVINLPALAERNADALARNEGEARTSDAHTHATQPANAPSAASGGIADEGVRVPSDPLGRTEGQALCPEWFDEKALDRVKRKLGSYSFAALYQQKPVPAEGGLFKRAWFQIINAAPQNLRWKRGYDLGISRNSTSDYTASLRVAYDKAGNMYIDGGFRRRIEYPEQRRFILGRIATENNTEHGIELSANGNAVVQDLRSETSTRGRALRGVKVKGDKVTNALPWIALAEEGKVFLVKGAWNTDFIDEAASFPSGTHDDQIDAVSIAVRMHRERSGRLYTF